MPVPLLGLATRRLAASGGASRDVAWNRYCQLAAWPTWSPQIVGVDADGDQIAAGLTGTVHGFGGLALPFTITAVDHLAHTWSWVVRWGPVAVTLNHEVHRERRGSGTVLVMEGPQPVLLGYAPLAWIALRRLVALRT